MACKHCNRSGIHLCPGLIADYQNRFTPEEREAQHKARMESLQRAIEAGKVLKEKYGIELVCQQ